MISNFNYSQIKSADRDILIDNLQETLEDLNLKDELHPQNFKLSWSILISLIRGSNYRVLQRAGSLYQELENMNEMFRVAEDRASYFKLDYFQHRKEIFEHLNNSTSERQFVNRLKRLGQYLDKGLRSKDDIGTIDEGMTYENNILLIKYDFTAYY